MKFVSLKVKAQNVTNMQAMGIELYILLLLGQW